MKLPSPSISPDHGGRRVDEPHDPDVRYYLHVRSLEEKARLVVNESAKVMKDGRYSLTGKREKVHGQAQPGDLQTVRALSGTPAIRTDVVSGEQIRGAASERERAVRAYRLLNAPKKFAAYDRVARTVDVLEQQVTAVVDLMKELGDADESGVAAIVERRERAIQYVVQQMERRSATAPADLSKLPATRLAMSVEQKSAYIDAEGLDAFRALHA